MFSALLIAGMCGPVSAADETAFDTASDYIKDCKYATCVTVADSEWSEKNPFGVAVSVRIGTKPAVTDDQIKMVLTHDLQYYDINNIKFFFEHYDAPASVINLHVSGGTGGPFVISNVRQEIESVARRAKNTNPALLPN